MSTQCLLKARWTYEARRAVGIADLKQEERVLGGDSLYLVIRTQQGNEWRRCMVGHQFLVYSQNISYFATAQSVETYAGASQPRLLADLHLPVAHGN
jgi:hypothetical protein